MDEVWRTYYCGDISRHYQLRAEIEKKNYDETKECDYVLLTKSFTEAIGHLASVEYIYKAVSLGKMPSKKIILVSHRGVVSNPALLMLYATIIEVVMHGSEEEYEMHISKLKRREMHTVQVLTCSITKIDLYRSMN